MQRTGYNKLVINAYNNGAAVRAGLENAQNITFSGIYPGGLFGNCTFFVPRTITHDWALRVSQKIVITNGIKTVWEGSVTAVSINMQGEVQGNNVTCMGYWADILMARTWRKWWADTRVGDDAWEMQEGVSGLEDLWEIEQDFGYIHILPKETTFANGDHIAIRYTMPTGETVKRITYDYSLQENTQQWEMLVWDVTGAAALAGSSVTATGTGSHDITLATPRQAIELRMYARQNQVADYTKHVHAEWNNLTIYSETGSINLTEIAKDVRGKVTELSSTETYIGSNTLSLVPFISEIDTYADILTRATAYGDSSFNAWAVGVRESDLSTDNKPVLFVEQYPALTDYDYAVSIGDANFQPGFEAEQDISAVRNWIAVRHTNASGFQVVITPDDDANLKDTTSIAAYGERHEWLDIDTTSTTTAKNYARRFLAARKDPQWRVSSGISVVGYIRGKGGNIIPASEIRAGKRVRIENFLNDLNGSGLTLLITGTDYDDGSETCRISVGQPDTLDVWLAQTVK